MKRRSELKAEVRHLEEENAVLRHAMMQRVNTFIQEGAFLGCHFITTSVQDDGKTVVLERVFLGAKSE